MPAMWAGLIGAGLGAYSSYQNSRNRGGTQTETRELPHYLTGIAPDVVNSYWQAGVQPYTPYLGERVAGFSPYQNMGFDMTAGRAMDGGLLAGAEGALTRGFGSAYTPQANPYAGADNPYLQASIDASTRDVERAFNRNVLPSIDTMSARANTGFGTSSAADQLRTDAYRELGQTVGDISNRARMDDYFRQQQLGESAANRGMDAYFRNMGVGLQAAGMAPGLDTAGYQGADRLLGIGGQMTQQGQRYLDADLQQFQEAQGYPLQQANILGTPLGYGGMGGSTTRTSTSAGLSPWEGALGGALGGLGMYRQTTGQWPWANWGSGSGYNPNYGFQGSGSGYDGGSLAGP